MTQQEEDEHEDLERLFARTASDASGPTLTKLAAHAADIPGRARRKHSLPRWAWGPAFAGAVVALGGMLLALRAPQRGVAPARSPELGSSAPVASLTVVSASAREVNAAAPHPSPSLADEASDGPELLGDADEGARFDVSGPQSDRDLDAWLAATKELSGGT